MIRISKAIEAKSFLELLWMLRRPIENLESLCVSRMDISCSEELSLLLDNDHYFWVFKNFKSNIAYSIACSKYYSDNSFDDIRRLHSSNLNDFFKYIIDNSEKIDKMYKMKAFL